MNNYNLNALFKEYNMQNPSKKSVKSSKSSSNSDSSAAVAKTPELKVGLNQTFGPPKVEEEKVVQYVTYVYYTMYPMKANVYPSHWVQGVVDTYQKIRKERAKIRKGDLKDGMKGLRLHIVVGVILYCVLVGSKIAIPTPLFIKHLNDALNMYRTKIDKTPIDIQKFEQYRTDNKPKGKGIKPFLKKHISECYKDLEPEDLVEFTAFDLLKLPRKTVYNVTKKVAELSKSEFKENEPPSYIAIAALYISGINNGKSINHNTFGITEYKLKQSVNTVIKAASKNAKLAKLIEPFENTSVNKKASIKMR